MATQPDSQDPKPRRIDGGQGDVTPFFPDPVLLRDIIRRRRLRGDIFGSDFFADPAWDILLDLAVAHAERKRVSITSLCIASGVPSTTALRWINQLIAAGLLQRIEDETDRRRAFVTLTERAVDAMSRYFATDGPDPRPRHGRERA